MKVMAFLSWCKNSLFLNTGDLKAWNFGEFFAIFRARSIGDDVANHQNILVV